MDNKVSTRQDSVLTVGGTAFTVVWPCGTRNPMCRDNDGNYVVHEVRDGGYTGKCLISDTFSESVEDIISAGAILEISAKVV